MKRTDNFTGVLSHLSTALRGNTKSFSAREWQEIKSRAGFWRQLFTFTVLAAYLYIFMEWIFFVTMPSFMSLLSFFDRLKIFLVSGFALALLGLVALVIFILFDTLTLTNSLSKITRYLGILIPTLILSALALLLVDNFTYTVFKFGISTSAGIWRGVYGFLFTVLTLVIYGQVAKTFHLRRGAAPNGKLAKGLFSSAIALLVVSAFLSVVNKEDRQANISSQGSQSQLADHLPNILLIGSDGVNADFMSVYGYYRDTTPRLRELAGSSLVAENAFTNSGNTSGSIISIMTSKLPTQTRVLYPPDILSGVDAYQHMPGILKNLGYTNVEFGAAYYGDAFSLNVQHGFDVVNNRPKSEGRLAKMGRNWGYEHVVYFLDQLTQRIFDRVRHIYYIQEMQNPYKAVTRPVPSIKDEEKVNQLLGIFQRSKTPVFIHAHLLGTHGGYYSPKVRMYSKGEVQSAPWMPDFYADTIHGFDGYIGDIIDTLKARGEYDNTLIVVYSDHNQQFAVDKRVPLIIHFPRDQYAGKITSPVENLDIAPTILDYLGLEQPDWMEGTSLLSENLEAHRLIFSSGTNKVAPNENDVNFLDPKRNKPPFYQFSYIHITNCQAWYTFDLTDLTWTSGKVANYLDPCDEADLLGFDEIKNRLRERLTRDGFDVSSLP